MRHVNIELLPARSDQLEIVRSLFAYYVYDLSEFGGWDIADDGNFDVPEGLANYRGGPQVQGSRWRP
jgi:hypothetical protein